MTHFDRLILAKANMHSTPFYTSEAAVWGHNCATCEMQMDGLARIAGIHNDPEAPVSTIAHTNGSAVHFDGFLESNPRLIIHLPQKETPPEEEESTTLSFSEKDVVSTLRHTHPSLLATPPLPEEYPTLLCWRDPFIPILQALRKLPPHLQPLILTTPNARREPQNVSIEWEEGRHMIRFREHDGAELHVLAYLEESEGQHIQIHHQPISTFCTYTLRKFLKELSKSIPKPTDQAPISADQRIHWGCIEEASNLTAQGIKTQIQQLTQTLEAMPNTKHFDRARSIVNATITNLLQLKREMPQ